MSGTDEVQYLVLPDATNPYFLARVRWPDVCQAISPVRPYWQDDPGLFDLPYDPSSTPVTLDQAAAIAADWNACLPSDAEVPTPELALVRRMPADWSNLSRAEQRAWSIDSMRTRPAAAAEERSGQDIAASGSRVGRLRLRLRRRAVTPSFEAFEVPNEELVPDFAGASVGALSGESIIVLEEEPATNGRGLAVEDDVIDLTDTSEDAPAAVEGA